MRLNVDNQSLQCGITGGMGAGKTMVCSIFASMGVPVYDADSEARHLMTRDRNIIVGIKALFGDQAYLPDGQLNRPFISQMAFPNPELLQKLNELVHPAVLTHGNEWHKNWQEKNVPYTLKEAALLIESGSYKSLDAIILVTAPLEIRIRRAMERDQASEESVRSRIARQMPEEEKRTFADFEIINDGKKMLIPQIFEIHQKLLSKSGLLKR